MKRILFVFFIAASLSASEEILLIRQADAYFQAKEYDRAYELYESLLKEKIAPWQVERVRYNLGTILFSKGDSKGALEQFSQVSFSVEDTPYLSRALQTNLAILNYRIARAVLSGEIVSIEEYSRAFFYLRAALVHVEKAGKAGCRLQLYKGLSDCRAENDLKVLRHAIKNKLAIVLDKYGDSKIADASIKEGIPYLISGTNLAESHLDFLESIPADNPLKEVYQLLFTQDMQSWEILWDSQEEKMEELEEPRVEFEKGIRLMAWDKYEESRLAFLNSEALLSKIMRKLWGDDPFMDLLRKLLTSYQYALDQVPVQPSTLYQLVVEQKQVRGVVEDGALSLEFLTFSFQQLQVSLDYAREGKRELARYYLEDARQWIRRLLRGEDTKPDEVLEASIQDQMHALTLNHILDQIKEVDDNPISLLRGAQEFTLQTTQPFIESVLAKQTREWPKYCQCKPWNRVIPLFVKGEQAAIQAKKFLKQETSNSIAMRKQEEAVKYWKEALDKMRHPEEEKEEKKKEEQQEEPPPPSEEEESKQSIDEVMRQLQSMYLDDRQPKSGSKQTQKGIRPW